MKIAVKLPKLLIICAAWIPFLQNCGAPNLDSTTDNSFRDDSRLRAGISIRSEDATTPRRGYFAAIPPNPRDYKALFGVHDPYSKVVDNHGDGFDTLYGVRNFRVVLHGIFYRGGANNAYNKYGRRDNQNPLPTLGLKNLCETGFTNVVYFYPTNFQSAPKNLSCESSDGASHVDYRQITALAGDNYLPMLEMIYDRINAPEKGPIYGHCWNGWHASGFISAIALKQFCGYSADAAENYWVKNTDGASSGYDEIRSKIRGFRPLAKWNISQEMRAKICP